jgi:hypothetical protein
MQTGIQKLSKLIWNVIPWVGDLMMFKMNQAEGMVFNFEPMPMIVFLAVYTIFPDPVQGSSGVLIVYGVCFLILVTGIGGCGK